MTIHEPMTLATDYLLGAVSAWFAYRLFGTEPKSRFFWAVAFAALALGAFLGGTWHGFVQSEGLWKATVLSVGTASFAMVTASAYATLAGTARNIVICLAAGKLLGFWHWMFSHDEFIYVVIDTAIAFLVVAGLHLWRLNGWILAGVALSVVAGLAQASGYDLHQYFNHNDLYHLIQVGAMLLFYRGASRITDA